MITELKLRPSYNHRHQKQPPRTTLIAETASPHYDKLKEFIGISQESEVPAWDWRGNIP